MPDANSPKPNPALKDLEVLPGDWEMELSNAAFLPSPSATVKRPMSFEWLEAGAFLLMRMGDKPPNPSDAVWLISRDDSSGDYRVFYYDARTVSRVYEMSFSENVWKIWRESPGFWQRYEGKLSTDGNTIAGHWEKSSDGATWEHDFDVTYIRKK